MIDVWCGLPNPRRLLSSALHRTHTTRFWQPHIASLLLSWWCHQPPTFSCEIQWEVNLILDAAHKLDFRNEARESAARGWLIFYHVYKICFYCWHRTWFRAPLQVMTSPSWDTARARALLRSPSPLPRFKLCERFITSRPRASVTAPRWPCAAPAGSRWQKRVQTMLITLLFTKVTTNTSKSLSLAAWTIIITLCCLQACLCACIPCCMDSCHKVRRVKFLFDCFIGLRKFRSSITAQTANNYWVCTVDLVNPTLTLA